MDNVDIKEFYNTYEPGLFIRASGVFDLTSHFGLFCEGRFSRGIAAINKENYTDVFINSNEPGKVMSSGLFLGGGLRFYLSGKTE